MIRAEKLSKYFGANPAVSEVSLHVKKQDIVGLVGPDGAGKTTLIRMICGLITPDSGEVSLMDLPPEKINRSKLGYMPQYFSLYGDLSVMENINFFGSMYGLSQKTIEERADEVLQITGLFPFKARLAADLSGGMRQKLALTCSLITRPDILILDEPTYGVDPESRKEFWKILYRLNQEGITILLSTPYMDEAELCKNIALINQGKAVAFSSPTELKSRFPHRILEVRACTKDPYFFNNIPEILDSSFFGYKYHLIVENVETGQQAAEAHLSKHNIQKLSITEIQPSMEDVFVLLTKDTDI
ncbi:MAG: ABC transporter ATP-binding protein [Syntrophomonadaceae bacterium]|nr:ABC transporter ATP-binding protein [Syntrophomonadaceae bacterium]